MLSCFVRNGAFLVLRMHATEAESEGLATFGGGIGSMLPMQRRTRHLRRRHRQHATDATKDRI